MRVCMYVCILETLNLASYIATIYISIQIQPHCVRADDYARDLNSSESKSSPNVAIVGIIDAPNSDHLMLISLGTHPGCADTKPNWEWVV